MIAFDTNVLVRLIVEDDPRQLEEADRWLKYCEDSGEPCLIQVPVLCELLWVLKRSYKASRDSLAMVVESFLDGEPFAVEAEGAVRQALDRFRKGQADFADYLIGVNGRNQGARTTVTFDAALREEEGFTWLDVSEK